MIRLLATAGILLFVVGADAAAKGLYRPTVETLENGLQVVVIEDHRAPVVSHMVWYKVGSADEEPGKSGLAHYLEHLMFKGTTKVPGGEFSRIVARNGGQDNAFTSTDYTGYFQNVAKDKLELVMELEADRMVNLTLSERDVETERLVVQEERRSRTDNNPSAQLGETMRASLYLSHPYRIPVIGWKHEVDQLTLEDVKQFYRRYYAPNNAILIVAGDVVAAEVIALARKHYGPLKAIDLPVRSRPQEPPHRAARRVELVDEKVGQPIMRRSYLAPARPNEKSPDAKDHTAALVLLSDILGGGTTSRLYQELVVKRKVAAAAGAYFSPLSLDRTSFYVYAAPVPGGSLEEVEKAVDQVLADFIENGATTAEMERARTNALASAIYSRDSLFNGPRLFGSALTTGLTVDRVESWPDRVRKITVAEVNGAAGAVLDLRYSVTGLLRRPEVRQ
jgi:zinc protease